MRARPVGPMPCPAASASRRSPGCSPWPPACPPRPRPGAGRLRLEWRWRISTLRPAPGSRRARISTPRCVLRREGGRLSAMPPGPPAARSCWCATRARAIAGRAAAASSRSSATMAAPGGWSSPNMAGRCVRGPLAHRGAGRHPGRRHGHYHFRPATTTSRPGCSREHGDAPALRTGADQEALEGSPLRAVPRRGESAWRRADAKNSRIAETAQAGPERQDATGRRRTPRPRRASRRQTDGGPRAGTRGGEAPSGHRLATRPPGSRRRRRPPTRPNRHLPVPPTDHRGPALGDPGCAAIRRSAGRHPDRTATDHAPDGTQQHQRGAGREGRHNPCEQEEPEDLAPMERPAFLIAELALMVAVHGDGT